MDIKTEIKQVKSFKTAFHEATVNLVFTQNWLSVQLKNFLKPYGCTLQQYNVLRILKGALQPISTSDIRHRMVEKMADTSRLVQRLSTKGWVISESCSEDKRLVDVSISDEGISFLGQTKDFDDYVHNLYDNLTYDEVVQLNKILDKLRNG